MAIDLLTKAESRKAEVERQIREAQSLIERLAKERETLTSFLAVAKMLIADEKVGERPAGEPDQRLLVVDPPDADEESQDESGPQTFTLNRKSIVAAIVRHLQKHGPKPLPEIVKEMIAAGTYQPANPDNAVVVANTAVWRHRGLFERIDGNLHLVKGAEVKFVDK